MSRVIGYISFLRQLNICGNMVLMLQRIYLLLSLFGIFFILTTVTVFAKEGLRPFSICNEDVGFDCCNSATGDCVVDGSYQCLPSKITKSDGSPLLICQESTVGKIFGRIQAPAPIAGFLQRNPTGASAISNFLSNAITLIYSLAGVALVFVFLWGAFEWMASGGDKEKVAAARSKIINGVIGIILFAVAFAALRILGQFTGFTFFKGT